MNVNPFHWIHRSLLCGIVLASSVSVVAQDTSPEVVEFVAAHSPRIGSVRPLSEISLSAKTEAAVPENRFDQAASELAATPTLRYRTVYNWVAPGLAHNPLYTEDVALERYGWTYGPVLQPFASGGHFLKDVALLPYQMGLDSPCDVQCNLGYRRPGSCAPQVKKDLPWSWKGAAFQAGAVVGAAALFP